MIIDFRLRPATHGFLNMHIFRNQERIARWSGNLGMTPPPSAKQCSLDLMFKEMAARGRRYGRGARTPGQPLYGQRVQ